MDRMDNIKNKIDNGMMFSFLGILGITGSITLYKVVSFIGMLDFQLIPNFMK